MKIKNKKFNNLTEHLVAVVVELVVAGESQQGSEPGTQREKDLGGRCYPNLNSAVFFIIL